MDHYKTVRETLEFIDENLDEIISLDDLSQKAHISKYHYHRLFHKITGESVARYIAKKRMEKAAQELAETTEPLIAIALKYQYSSQESFSRAFMRIYNLTPGKYRKTFAGNKHNNTINISRDFKQMKAMAA